MKKRKVRLPLIIYDMLILIALEFFLLGVYEGEQSMSWQSCVLHGGIMFVCIFVSRLVCGTYQQIWRYGGIQCYMGLLAADALGFIADFLVERIVPFIVPELASVNFARLL